MTPQHAMGIGMLFVFLTFTLIILLGAVQEPKE